VLHPAGQPHVGSEHLPSCFNAILRITPGTPDPAAHGINAVGRSPALFVHQSAPNRVRPNGFCKAPEGREQRHGGAGECEPLPVWNFDHAGLVLSRGRVSGSPLLLCGNLPLLGRLGLLRSSVVRSGRSALNGVPDEQRGERHKGNKSPRENPTTPAVRTPTSGEAIASAPGTEFRVGPLRDTLCGFRDHRRPAMRASRRIAGYLPATILALKQHRHPQTAEASTRACAVTPPHRSSTCLKRRPSPSTGERNALP
jgi:hypothetical protein